MKLQKQKEYYQTATSESTPEMMTFKSEVESIVFNNYLPPTNVFEGMTFGSGDMREFKNCKKCPPLLETTKAGETPKEEDIIP